MKFFSRGIDKFCNKHRRFGISNLMLYIVIGNAIVYLFGLMDRTGSFLGYLYFNPAMILRGQVWRIVTFLFIPTSSNIFFEALALYFYYFIGSTLERYWGTGKFTIYYIFGALLTMLYGFIYGLAAGADYIYISSTYINLSMFFAFATLFPDTMVMLFFFIPIKIKWLALVDAAMFVYGIIVSPFPLNLLPVVAILNFLLFCGDIFIDMFKSNRSRYKAANSKQAINFKKAAREAKRQESERPYRHKCAVCGRTDADYPNLQFRYCSRCAGYHCFCEDHINNHIHFTENDN